MQLRSLYNKQKKVMNQAGESDGSIAPQFLNEIVKHGTSSRSLDSVKMTCWVMHVMMKRSILAVVAWTAGAGVEWIAEVFFLIRKM